MFRAWLLQVGKRWFGPRSRAQTFRRKPRSRPLQLEALEDRCVPTNVVFTPQYGAQQTSRGGDVLTGNIPVYLIFAGGQGARYGYDGSVTPQALITAVNNILNSPYLSGLSEYGAATQAHVAGTYVSNQPVSDVGDIVDTSINDNGGALPEPDDTDTDGIYMVFIPTGYILLGGTANGFHEGEDTGTWLIDPDHADYGVVGSLTVNVPIPLPTANQPASQVKLVSLSALDSMSVIFSHELVETITDPDDGGVKVTPPGSFHQNYSKQTESPGEIGDNEAEFYGAHENGTAVQSYWSAQGGAYIVPGGANRFAVDLNTGSASMVAFERTLTSVQYATRPTGGTDVYALDNQANLWRNFGFEWQQVDSKVRSFTLFGDTPIITYINDPPFPQTPFADQAVTTTTPTFTWDAVAGATSYSVSVTDAQTHLVVASASSLTGTSWTPSTPLTDGRGYQWQVQAYTPLNGSVVASKPSSPIFFFVNVGGALTLTSPAPGAKVTTGTPTLQWTPIPGAFTFELSLYDVTTGTPVINTPGWTISTSSFNLTVPLPSGHKYHWTVTGDDSAHTTASAEFTVSVPGATGQLAAPTLTGPSGLLTTGTPTFQWSAVPGAAGYGLYVFRASSSSYSWANPILVSGTSYTPSRTLNDGFYSAYVWWVTAYDNAGNVSPVSQSLDIGMAVPSQWVGTATAAAPSGTVNTLNPTFQWSAVSGAEGSYGYYLNVLDETLHTVALSKYVSGATSYTLGSQGGAALLNGHTYRWYVAALTLNGLGPASTQTFTTAFPGTPTPLSPGGPQPTAKPTLQWSASTGASGYYLTLTDQTTGRTLLDSLSLTATSYTLSAPLSDSDTYLWQVVAYDGVGDVSPATTPVSFTVVAGLAGPALVSLANPVPTLTPTLQWSAVTDAAGYNLHLVDATTNTETVTALTAPTTLYTVAPLVDGHGYRWWVEAYDSAGNLGPAPAALTFNVQLPPPPTRLTPSGIVVGTPTLQWLGPTNTLGYVVQILDVTAAQPAYVVGAAPVSGTSYTPGTSLTDGRIYQWRVRSLDRTGNTSDWSSAVQFTVGADEARSTLAAGTTSLAMGESTTITLTARDANGNPEKTGGLSVTFGLGSGSGQGTFGPVQDNGDGTYSVTFTATAAGTNTVTATVDGQAVTSTPPTLVVTVSSALTPTTTFVNSSATSVVRGQPVTFTAYVSGSGPANPSGTVTFYDDSTALGTADLNYLFPGTASASLSTSALSTGSHTITAVYSGDSEFQGSTSTQLTQTITPAGPATTAYALGADNQVYGQSFDATGKSTGAPWLVAPGQVLQVLTGKLGTTGSELFVLGLDNQIYALKLDASGKAVGGYFLGRPGQVRSFTLSDGPLPHLYALGLDSQVYEEQFDANGNATVGFSRVALGQVKSFTVQTTPFGEEVFAIGLDNQVYAVTCDASGNPTSSYFLVGPGQVNAVAVAHLGTTGNELFVLGLDAQVYALKLNGSGRGVGGYFLGKPGQVKSFTLSDGPLPHLYAIGLDSQVYEEQFDANGNATVGFGLVAAGQIKSFTVHTTPSGEEVFAVGLDNQVYGVTCDAGGNPTSPYALAMGKVVEGMAGSQAAATTRPLFAVGTDGQVYRQSLNVVGLPSGPVTLAATGKVLALAAGSNAYGDPEVWVIGLDNQVYAHKFTAAGTALGSYFLVAPGAVKALAVGRDGLGKPELFVIGLDNQVYAQQYTASGDPLGGYFLTTPGAVKAISVTSNIFGQPELFVVGLDSQVYVQPFTVGGLSAGGYVRMALGAVLSVSATRNALGVPEIFVVGLDIQVYVQHYYANGQADAGYSLAVPGPVKAISAGSGDTGTSGLFVLGQDGQVYVQMFGPDGNVPHGSHYSLFVRGSFVALSTTR